VFFFYRPIHNPVLKCVDIWHFYPLFAIVYFIPCTAYMISSVKDRHRWIRISFILYLFILCSADKPSIPIRMQYAVDTYRTRLLRCTVLAELQSFGQAKSCEIFLKLFTLIQISVALIWCRCFISHTICYATYIFALLMKVLCVTYYSCDD